MWFKSYFTAILSAGSALFSTYIPRYMYTLFCLAYRFVTAAKHAQYFLHTREHMKNYGAEKLQKKRFYEAHHGYIPKQKKKGKARAWWAVFKDIITKDSYELKKWQVLFFLFLALKQILHFLLSLGLKNVDSFVYASS